ncbi:unnamed protein product [Penicillium salamii]|nr:unnamed protein product [Penicillium salamii]CAG8156156.1 unnamed protein product [Penicillium salamii]CAG8380922.1 unnamed protein product [Penicillium salamii]
MTDRDTVSQPPNALLTVSRPSSGSDRYCDYREALELHEIQTHEDNQLDLSDPSASSGEEYVVHRTPSRTSRASRTSRSSRDRRPGIWGRVCHFWTNHVILTVPQKSNRDHFGRVFIYMSWFCGSDKIEALERTFLAYIRTSTVIAMQGVLVAQLFRLQRPTGPVDRLSFHDVGVPLSVACHFVAVIVALIGAFRFWKQQNAMARGKIFAGGWELNSVGVFLFIIIMVTLVLSVIILIQIDMVPRALVNSILRL